MTEFTVYPGFFRVTQNLREVGKNVTFFVELKIFLIVNNRIQFLRVVFFFSKLDHRDNNRINGSL